MNITGFTKRSIADQTGIINYVFTVTPLFASGSGQFGLSGTNTFGFNFSNGKIYDKYNRFIYSYRPNEPITISGHLTQAVYDVYINNRVIELGQSITTGKYSWIYANSSNNFDFSASIRGDVPDYSLYQSGVYRHSGASVTGYIINNNPSSSFRIFDASINLTSSEYFVTNFSTGNITGSGYFVVSSNEEFNSNFVLPIVLDTNFGQLEFGFFVSGNATTSQDSYLSISPALATIEANTRNDYTVYFANSGGSANIGVALYYVSGITGNIYDLETVVKTNESGLVSGFVSGVQQLNKFHTGIVSQTDPKTSVLETGIGTGYLFTNNITGAGAVTITYLETVYGFGTGSVTTNYTASGLTNLSFSGNVPILGTYLTGLGYNFSGTGHNPSLASGLVSVGTGILFVRPTGVFPLTSGLNVNDYEYAYITLAKTYSGPISYYYNATGIGYATGETISGIVRSDFNLNFEPGYYVFGKFYSGIVSGEGINTGNFNPVNCSVGDGAVTSGVLSGYFRWSGYLNCDTLNVFPSITFTGYPTSVYGATGNLLSSNKVVAVVPNNGFLSTENSSTVTLGGSTRTLISHNGPTPSGTGYFSGVVGYCSTNLGVWREKPGFISESSGKFYSPSNQIGYYSFESYITGSGNSYANTGYFDSGVIYFTVTGSGLRYFGFSALASSLSGPQGVDLVLYDTGGQIARFNYDSALDLRYFGESVNSYYEKGGVIELTSGDYKLVITSKELEAPEVGFYAEAFSGCESDNYLRFRVDRRGSLLAPVSVLVSYYTEITAHSGVNYTPVTGRISWNSNDSQPRYFDIPIYDNAAFGKNHEFIVGLSNPSGCDIYRTETRGIILDNDSYKLVTGITDIYSSDAVFVTTGEYMGTPDIITYFREYPAVVGCQEITTPIFIEDQGDYFEKGQASIVRCPCPMISTTGTGLLPSSGSGQILCGSLEANGIGIVPAWTYLGNLCANQCTINTLATIANSPPNYIEVLGIPESFLPAPSGAFNPGDQFTGTIFETPAKENWENVASGGFRGNCSRLHFFYAVHSYGSDPWNILVTATRSRNNGILS